MIFRLFFILLMMLGTTASLDAQTAPPAAEILQKAYVKAARENKSVFVLFTASWCGWCKAMDKSMNDSTIKPLFEKNYVITHLVVKELKDKRYLVNPGAEDFLRKYNGEKQGIPFFLILNKDGNLLADSQIRPAGASLDVTGDNIGCPASENEVAAFIQILRKTSKLNTDELNLISARFSKNKQGH